ncbi:MAG: serine/threonine protein kinase [Chloroflexota bacterium]|nr:MAG: serine/threonine protein kinase [Chloroflexota bacterium]
MKPADRAAQNRLAPKDIAWTDSFRLSQTLNKLPLQLTSFIGRERELAKVKDLMARVRLLTLTGPGGSGKTRLASQVVTDLLAAAEYPDGIAWVELSSISDPELIPQAVATAMSVREQPGYPLIETVIDYLRSRQVLLILDNCEHIVSACAGLVNSLLRSCPHGRILATSRAPLRVEGETTWPVPPLAVPAPDWWTGITPGEVQTEELARFEAVQLFTARAAAVFPAFRLSIENAAAVAQICCRLDGLPLALELAAARIKVLSAAQIAERLDDALALLTRGSPLAARRQQTLRATLDWSYELLAPPEQILLRWLAVFVGGFTLEAAEEICSDEMLERAMVLDTLSNLVDQSLVVVEQSRDSRPRYRLLETIRQYSQEKLQAAGERILLRDRHLAWCLALVEEAETGLRGSQQVAWLGRLEREHDNLRAALDWGQEAGHVESGLRLAASLHWFWDRRGYLSEGCARLQTLLERSQEPPASGLTLPVSFQQARASALYGAASLAFDQGDNEASAAWAEESVALFRQLNDRRGLALALPRLAFASGLASDQARRLLAESLEIAQELDEVWLIALNHMLVGQIAFFQGDYLPARAELEVALALLRRIGDRWGLVHTLGPLGMIELAQREFNQARSYLEESLLIARDLGDTRSMALIAASVADVARCQKEYDRAAELYGESMELYRRLGNKAELPAILHNLGYVALGQGKYEAARTLFIESLQQQLERDNKAGIAEGLAGLAALAGVQAAPERAAQLFGAAAGIREAAQAPVWPAERLEIENYEATVRAQLNGPTFAALQTAGRALTLEQAVAYALQSGPEAFRQATEGRTGLLPRQAVKQQFGGLTAREREVAALIAQGQSNRAIAEALVITERTAERHVANIMSKLGFTSRVQIAAWTVQKGLSQPTSSS